MTLRKIQFDGLTIETTDAGAEAMTKLQQQLSDAKALLKTANDAIDGLKADKAKLAEDHAKALADAAAKIPTADQLEAMLDSRTAMIETAKKLAPSLADSFKGKSGADVRKTVVAHKLGDTAVKDKSTEHIAAQFDTLALFAGTGGATDPVRDALAAGVQPTTANDARAKYLADTAGAWAN